MIVAHRPGRVRMCLLLAVVLATGAAACSDDAEPEAGSRTPEPLPTTAAPSEDGKAGQPRTLVSGLEIPWAISFFPGGDAVVTERESARLLKVTRQGQVTQLGKVPGVVAEGEGGLMGVAVSPSFSSDRLVYLYFTAKDDNRVVRFRVDGDRIGRLEPVITGIPKGSNHDGGRIEFGPDKMLYAATGETGNVSLAQNRRSKGGKILRTTPDGKPAPGNPFDGSIIWSYGHRNVQGMAWDQEDRMYATEFGQDRFDEVNRIEKGKNYGWPDVEGFGSQHTRPELTWTTDESSPSGMSYAKGSLWVAGLRGERLWQVPLSKDGKAGRPKAHFTDRFGRLRGVATAPDGSVWVTTSNKDGRGDPRKGDDKILVLPLS